jgi:hypothetical protein
VTSARLAKVDISWNAATEASQQFVATHSRIPERRSEY